MSRSKMTEPTIRQQYRIPRSLVNKARTIAKRERTTTSEIVRRALTAFEDEGPETRLERELRGIRRLLEDLAGTSRGRK